MADSKHTASKLFLSTYGQATNPNIQKISDSRYVFKVEPYILHNDDPAHFVLGLEQASIPQSFYTFNSTNNVFNFVNISLAVVNTITIPVGNYLIEDLVDYLSATTNALYAGATITYSYLTNKLSLVNATAFLLSIQQAPPIAGIVSTSFNQLGYNQAAPENAIAGATKEFTYCVNLTTTAGINIRINNVITQNRSSKGSNDSGASVIARLPINSGAMTWCQYFNPVVFYLTLTSRTINFFDVELLDDALKPIVFNIQNPNWFVVLKIDYINKEANSIPKTAIQTMRDATPQPTSTLANIGAPKAFQKEPN